jgi:hypothetical protein
MFEAASGSDHDVGAVRCAADVGGSSHSYIFTAAAAAVSASATSAAGVVVLGSICRAPGVGRAADFDPRPCLLRSGPRSGPVTRHRLTVHDAFGVIPLNDAGCLLLPNAAANPAFSLSPLKRLAGGVSVCKSADRTPASACIRVPHRSRRRKAAPRDSRPGQRRTRSSIRARACRGASKTERPPTSTARAWTASRSRRSSPDHRLTPHKKPKPASLRGSFANWPMRPCRLTRTRGSNRRLRSSDNP